MQRKDGPKGWHGLVGGLVAHVKVQAGGDLLPLRASGGLRFMIFSVLCVCLYKPVGVGSSTN